MPPREPKIVLLRGINLGASNRVPMPALRGALTEVGYGIVRTYVQSGNIVLDTDHDDAALERAIARLIEERFDVSTPVLGARCRRAARGGSGQPVS